MRGVNLVAATVSTFFLSACAPPGYEYGRWTDGPTEAFTLHPRYQPVSDSRVVPQAASAPPKETFAQSEVRKFCARSSAAGCSLFVQDVSRCEATATFGNSIMEYEKRMRVSGATPKEAARLALRAIGVPNMQVDPRDLEIMAANAASLPMTTPSEEFRDTVLGECIENAKR